ncbi:MAG: hypothetical protein NXH75_09690 [Halobacteriovoraceae bacterium]|nr:hypothetical protein [Halobacteriovoraceae bacterium]
MKFFTLCFLLSLSVFGSEFSKAPFIGLVNIGFSEGDWERNQDGKVERRPFVEFYRAPNPSEAPVYTLDKNVTLYQDFIKEQEKLKRVKNFEHHKDYSSLRVLEKREGFLKLGKDFWIKEKGFYYFPIDGEVFRRRFNGVKVPPKGFFKEPGGKQFYPRKALKRLKARHGDAVVDFIDSKTINGIIWLKFTNFDKNTYGDKKGEPWEAWIPAFGSKGKPLFYYIGY